MPRTDLRKLRLLLIPLSIVFVSFTWAQNPNLYKADVPEGYNVGIRMRFINTLQPEISKPLIGLGNLQFVSFYLTASEPAKSTADKDTWLKCWNQSTERNKSGTYSLSNSGIAAIHIGFWGCSLQPGYATEIAAQPTKKPNYLVKDLIADVLEQSGNNLINIISGHEYRLLIFDLATESEAKSFFNYMFSNRMLSDHLYLIWDITAIPTLPPDLKESLYDSYTLHMKEIKPASVYFEPSKAWSKTKLTLSPLNKSGIPQDVPSGKSLPLNNKQNSRLLIRKPEGFNIVSKAMPDTLGWKKEHFEYVLSGRSGEDTLKLVPLTYSIIYIDPTRSNYIAINQSIDTIIQNNPGRYYVYLAWKNKPFIATDAEGLAQLKGKMYDLAFTTANYDSDIRIITKNLASDIKAISQRMRIRLDLYLPWENASEETEKFIIRFAENDMMNKQSIPCNLYIFGTGDQSINTNKIPNTKIHILKEK
jgi:hypothetical protein